MSGGVRGRRRKPPPTQSEDIMYGLTIKYFGSSYIETQKVIVAELELLTYQIDGYLQLKR